MMKDFCAILVGGLIIGGIVGFMYQQQRKPIENLIYGNYDAPIEIVNYTSFQCRRCSRFHETYR